MNNRQAWIKRLIVYIFGIMVLALGITLNTKTDLGVAPILSVPYSVSEIFQFGLGTTTFVWYSILILLQMALLGREFRPHQFLQIITSFLTSWFIGIYDMILPMAPNLIMRYAFLAAAIVITSIGIHLTVGTDIAPNPADGMANALGQKTKKGLGFGKNLLDVFCISLAIIFGLAGTGHLVGIGIGTVCTMVLTGRVVAFLAPWLAPKCRSLVAACARASE